MKRLIAVALAALSIVSCNEQDSDSTSGEEEKVVAPIFDYGKELYTQNCTQCHRLDKDMLGPALKGALGRWGNDTTALRAFIKNSTKVVVSGNEYAVAIYNKWNKTLMTPMPHLTDDDIDAIIDYTERAE